MKKILIIGKYSYIGTSLEKWLMKKPDKYLVDFISVRDDLWKEKDFSFYDVIFHAVGIAHVKETKENKNLYFEINRDLAYEVARKAKADGVKQFIFLSSMSVYGVKSGIITKKTLVAPKDAYGKSKAEAEKLINALRNESFAVVILRPPMVYGKDCKGNYQVLSKFAKTSLVFPNIENKRSMIYINNLSEYVRKIIDNCDKGIFCPQNKEPICTKELINEIAVQHSKKIYYTSFFNRCIIFLKGKIEIFDKVFGNLVYEEDFFMNNDEYTDFKQSIKETEK